MSQYVIVIGGTAGTGKSTIGEALSKNYNTVFVEGDDVHPKENVEKMSQGIPLTDEDRWGWLEQISKLSTKAAKESSSKISVVSCSALKKIYRETIQSHSPDTKFIYIFLYTSKEELIRRTSLRKNHFMKPAMLDSQFADLQLPKPEEEPNTLVIDVSKSVEEIVEISKTFIDEKVSS